LPQAATLSLYLHVPFCTELCRYWGCTTKAVRRRPPVDAYAQLLAEIELSLGRLLARGASFICTGAAARHQSSAPTIWQPSSTG
jgi:oxygen-independent coproporphyrinogen III oxidase